MRFYKKWFTKLGLSASIAAQSYKVINGTITWNNGVFSTTSSSSRMDFVDSNGEDLEVKFKYMGPTDNISLLASGAYQEQFGLKLRSSNTCNLVYVMRRISPISKITISYKQNIGMSTHEECGDKGYVFVKDILIPVIKPGTYQTLSARFDEDVLTVWVDNIKVWSGFVDYHISGIGGIRTDNVKTLFSLVE
jgi:hypothetical protein